MSQDNYDAAFQAAMPQQQQQQGQQAPQGQAQQQAVPQSDGNPYDAVFQTAMPGAKPTAQPQQSSTGSFMSMVDGFNKSFQNTAQGALQLLSPVLPDKFNQAVNANIAGNKVYNYGSGSQDVTQEQLNHPVATKVGDIVGQVAQFAALPTSKASVVSRVAANALGTGLLSAIQPGNALERTRNGLIGAAIGGGATAALEMAPTVVGLLHTGNATKTIANQVIQSGGKEVLDKGVQAANSLGEFIAPAEAIGGRVLPAKTAAMRLTEGEQFQLGNKLAQRESNVVGKIHDIINNFVPEGDVKASQLQKQLYDQLPNNSVHPDVVSTLKQNPNIASEFDNFGSLKHTQETASLPDNSISKLDLIKRQFDHQLYNGKSLLNGQERDLLPEEKQALQQARSQVVDAIDSASPKITNPDGTVTSVSQQARQLSERMIMKRDMMDQLNLVGEKAGEIDQQPLNKIYNRLWNTPEKQDNFLNAVQSSGGDVNTAKNVMTFVNQIRNSPLESLVKKPAEVGESPLKGGPEGIIHTFVNKLFKGNYNKELFDLTINSDKWQGAVKDIMNKPNQNGAIGAFKELLDNVKNSKLGSFMYNKFSNVGTPEVVAKPNTPVSELPIEKMSMEPRLKPEQYMGAELRRAAQEQSNAAQYHIQPQPGLIQQQGLHPFNQAQYVPRGYLGGQSR